MSATRLMAGCLAALLAAGCSHQRPDSAYEAMPWWADARARVVTEASDQRALSSTARSRGLVGRSSLAQPSPGATEPLTALHQSETWRATWKAEVTDYRTIRPSTPIGLPDPSTTAALRDVPYPVANPAQDAQASLGRLIDAGRKAAAPICRGC